MSRIFNRDYNFFLNSSELVTFDNLAVPIDMNFLPKTISEDLEESEAER